MRSNFLPVRARNGRTIRILLVVRVSSPGEGKQDIRSLDDQEKLLRQYVKAHIAGPYEITVIAGTGSGENLSRPEFLELCDQIESEQFDLVIVEDLARIARRMKAHEVCETCVDCGTRLISLNDNVDTAEAGWEDRSIFSSWHHQRSNRDTSDRIKRTLNSRFDNGGALNLPIFGYLKRPGATSDKDVVKVPTAEPIYREWFRRLENGHSFAAIADWLNAERTPTGPHAKSDVWTGRMVGRITRNTILKGERYRNERESYRLNNPGIYKTRKAAPESRRTRIVPELAFFEAAYYDRVIDGVNRRNGKYKRKGDESRDPLSRRAKKSTRFPGQCIDCGVCGRLYVFGGHGQTDHLMCDGARSHLCWNGATVDGPLAAGKLCDVALAEIEALPGFDDAYLASLNEEALRVNASLQDRLHHLDRAIAKVDAEIANLIKFIREGQASSALQEELARLEQERSRLTSEMLLEESRKVEAIELPPIDELKELGRAKFSQLALNSYEFAAELRRFMPRIEVFPHRLVDGGPVVLRAKLRLQLAALVPDRGTRSVVQESLERLVTVDLFDPPQRELHRLLVVEGRRAGEREADIARRLGITTTAAQRSMELQRLMDKLGVTDAYQPVTAPPTDGKLQRHKHARYRFEPLPDVGQV